MNTTASDDQNDIPLEDPRLIELREACLHSLWIFAQAVEPHRVYGECHKELFDWWQEMELEEVLNTLALMPRDHQKSHCIAVWVCWQIFKNPAVTIAYVCATESLAILQLYDIKQILTSDEFTRLSPDMIEPMEKKRQKWAETAIIVDHPIRKKERPRDPTVLATGLDSNNIGAHCNIMVKDDVVIDKNSLTETARQKVEAKAGHLSSILTTDGMEFCVGTRYHPKDHYQTLIDMTEEVWEGDQLVGERPVYAVHTRVVEVEGVFLWPRMARESDGKMFGFDRAQLSRKKAKYRKDMRNFYCQYYNDPNAINEGGIEKSMFLYYDKEKVVRRKGSWWVGKRKVNIIACQDFAYSVQTGSDWTALFILGMDKDKRIYILDIVRYQTKKPSVYWKNLETAYNKWKFKWVRAEAVAAQEVIIEALREYAEKEQCPIRIKAYKPNSQSGDKETRISQTLEPLYENGDIYHYRGGLCDMLEEELTQDRPPHDDLKDCLHIGVGFDKLKPPVEDDDEEDYDNYHDPHASYSYDPNNRFGGLQ
ncbi:hypothetical protein [Vibrio phage VpV262]|uniref:Terminase large subunit gp17-like C-terminal domain-containing protein n=1 Tax=Vibrio phage VpV262 TaxID=2907796 RepID=Q8LT43_9CAUD|nr:hypothetical protein VpV262p61 [Vibrio phage VpV262]AAM28398.1 hypothetical protein [Vibrio phage VpV262]